MTKKVYTLDFCGQEIQVETGELAKQAAGSVLVRYGDTAILSAATASKKAKDLPFFPLTVIFEEKLYSVGKIPGGFLRREGRPSEHATLTSRLIDRTIRPLFADGFRNEVQVVNTVLSVDHDYSADMAAMLGASLSLCISDIPFEGPIAGVTVALVDGEYIINPNQDELSKSEMELVVAGTKDAINMVEAGANEVSEEKMLEAMMFGHEYIKQLCEFQIEIANEIAKDKMEIELYQIPSEIEEEVSSMIEKELRAAVAITEKQERYNKIDEITAQVIEHFEAKDFESDKEKHSAISFAKEVVDNIVSDEVRRLISVEKIRPDGRKADEVRPLDVQIDLLNRCQ